jgi:RecA-family ATPase
MSETNTHSLGFNGLEQGKDTEINNLKYAKPEFDFNKYSIGVEDITAEVESLIRQGKDAKESKGLLTVKSANDWIEQAKKRPIPTMLFDVFWFEGEICILFADTNVGKSILAVQIGDSISKGEQISGFKLEAQMQPVLYLDFELSDKQFENRYSIEFQQHYIWPEYFIRVELNPDAAMPDNQSFEDYLNYSIERCIIETGAKILIIDNLTFLSNDNEKAKTASPLMKHLKVLKNKYGLSILILAHTPKRDMSKPINRNDLAGSKMLMNFCDSAFSIGESSTDKNLRYLKQIKERHTPKVYDAENVCICQINKPHNFLLFELLSFGSEREHLKQRTEQDNETQIEKVIHLKHQGKSYRDIGLEIGISHMTAQRIWEKNVKL